MVLTIGALAAELEAMPLVDNEAEAAENQAAAWDNFFQNATVNAIPVTPGATAPAKAAMKAALAGMSAPGAGPVLFEASLIAYWGSIATIAPVVWPAVVPPLASATPPPTLIPTAVTLALVPVFLANVVGELSKADSCSAIATALFPVAAVGGLGVVGVPPPPAYPIL